MTEPKVKTKPGRKPGDYSALVVRTETRRRISALAERAKVSGRSAEGWILKMIDWAEKEWAREEIQILKARRAEIEERLAELESDKK